MPDALVSAIEALVGAACVAAAWATWRVRAPRWLPVVLAVAGVTAVAHAAIKIA
jgi:hypothetical protein